MDGHQAHGVGRIDDGIRLVTDGEVIEVRDDALERAVAAILNPANDGADLLQVLARLGEARASQLDRVRRLLEDPIEQLRRRQPIGQGAPSGGWRPAPERSASASSASSATGGAVAGVERVGQARREAPEPFV